MMIDERIYQQFAEIGRDLYEHAMISSHGGNLSMRVGDHVIIKRRGAQLGRLKPHDLVETLIEKNDSGVTIASTELLAHRTIYHADACAGDRPLPSAHGDCVVVVARGDHPDR